MTALCNSSLQAVLAYTHLIPNWGYHGSARRWGDFSTVSNPKYFINGGIERILHHYGSTLNAIPIMLSYERNPDDVYLLETGIGAVAGVMTNVQPQGWTSMGFHADARHLFHEPWIGDWGLALYGHAVLSTSYLVRHPTLGWQAYLGDLTVNGDNKDERVTLQPRDSYHRRMFLEPIGTALELDTGEFVSAVLLPGMSYKRVYIQIERVGQCDRLDDRKT